MLEEITPVSLLLQCREYRVVTQTAPLRDGGQCHIQDAGWQWPCSWGYSKIDALHPGTFAPAHTLLGDALFLNDTSCDSAMQQCGNRVRRVLTSDRAECCYTAAIGPRGGSPPMHKMATSRQTPSPVVAISPPPPPSCPVSRCCQRRRRDQSE